MYKIKQIPEDFIVEEILKFNNINNGKYAYFILKKKNYNTLDAVNRIAKALKLKVKYIGFAGTKDKIAVTKQYISIPNISREKVETLKLKDISLKFAGRCNERLNLGNLEKNYFKITVRNLTENEVKKLIDKIEKLNKNYNNKESVNIKYINYFGEQRFGINSTNPAIGLALIKKDFKKAFELIISSHDNNNIPKKLQDYLNAKTSAKNDSIDYIKVIREIPKKLLKLYLAAYQSMLWNNVVSLLLKHKKIAREYEIPEQVELIGFDTEFKDKKVKEFYEDLMRKDNITLRDFIIRQLPLMSVEGSTRDVYAVAENFKVIETSDDELNRDMKKIVIEFYLGKGCYATEFIKQLFR